MGTNYRKTSPGELSGHIESKYAAFIRQKAALMDPALPAILAGHFSIGRMGVGRRLMNAARNWASQRNVKVFALATQKENASAKRLYESLGYELDTEFDHYELPLA